MEHNSSMPKTFVVSLLRSSQRRDFMSKQFDDLQIPFEFVDASDGSQLSAEDRKKYSKRATKKLLGFALIDSEIGCSLSHLRIYEKMKKEGIQEAVIFEDDAVVTQDVIDIIRRRTSFPADWEVINLATYTVSLPTEDEILPGYFISTFDRAPFGTLAYIIKLSAAKKLLELAYPIRYPSDLLLGRGGIRYFKTYATHPKSVHQFDLDSEIGARHHRPNLRWRIRRRINLALPKRFRKWPDLPPKWPMQ